MIARLRARLIDKIFLARPSIGPARFSESLRQHLLDRSRAPKERARSVGSVFQKPTAGPCVEARRTLLPMWRSVLLSLASGRPPLLAPPFRGGSKKNSPKAPYIPPPP